LNTEYNDEILNNRRKKYSTPKNNNLMFNNDHKIETKG